MKKQKYIDVVLYKEVVECKKCRERKENCNRACEHFEEPRQIRFKNKEITDILEDLLFEAGLKQGSHYYAKKVLNLFWSKFYDNTYKRADTIL